MLVDFLRFPLTFIDFQKVFMNFNGFLKFMILGGQWRTKLVQLYIFSNE